MNEVCSGCAGWVEKDWSYCEQCGAPRSPQRRQSLKPFLSIYANERKHSGLGRAPAAAAAYPLKKRGNIALVRRRESAEDVRRQLEHWGRKLNTQEHLLEGVERSNAVIRRAAASTAAIELRQAVHEGRKLVRHCSSSSTLSTAPTGPRQLRERRKLGPGVSPNRNPTRDYYGKRSVQNTNSFPGGTTAVGRASRHDHSSMNTCSFVATAPSILSMEGTANISTDNTFFPKGLSVDVETMLVEEEGGANIDTGGCATKPYPYPSKRAPAASTADSNGWFWGAGGRTGNGDGVCAVPGEGAMGAFWGGTNLSVAPLDTASIPSPAVRLDSTLNEERERRSYEARRHPSLTFIGVASAKAVVRSASNHTAELSYLLAEGHNAPREECLAKVESAVRAAQGAISCSNERVFELELKAAAAGQVREQDASMSSGDAGIGFDLDTCIAQLAEQLELAQSLLAASLAARARVTRRLSREDAAATLMQARVRGFHTRSRDTTANFISTKRRKILPLKAESPLVLDGDERIYGSSDDSTVHPPEQAARGQEEEEVETAELPREEEEWWTPAKAESADEIGELEASLLRAVVKLQAIVRSRLARSRTIAAVNARFVEYFDDHYQAPFYVCAETECSQWNRPFGFSSSFDDFSLRHEATSVDCTAGDGEEISSDAHASVLAQDGVPLNLLDEAAVVIQCAARSSQARALLVEKIVIESL